jgi:hypothetical protein
MALSKLQWQSKVPDLSPKWQIGQDGDVKKIVTQIVYASRVPTYNHDGNIVNYSEHNVAVWRSSEQGAWIIEHTVEPPTVHWHHDYNAMEDVVYVIAKLHEQDWAYFVLKWK